MFDNLKNETNLRLTIVIAMLWAAAGSFLFTVMWVLPKFVGSNVPPMQIGFIRYAAGAICIAPFFISDIRLPAATASHPKQPKLMGMHILRAACGVSSLVFGAYAVTRIPLANVQAIAMTNGVFTVMFAAIFLKEHVGWREVLSGSIALGGAVLVAGPGTAGAAGWALLGVLAAFAQAITWGAEVVFLKATATRDRASRILFIVNVAASVMVLITGVWFWEELSLEVYLLIAAMGPIAILGQICNIRAFRLTSATNLVPIRYSGIVFAALLGILFFDEWPDVMAIVGAFMIVAGAMWLALPSRSSEHDE